MNIFVLHSKPRLAARAHCDRHVVKMVLESCQLLSSAHHVLDGDGPLRLTHANHPCAIWTRYAYANYAWLADLADGLADEYFRRYGRRHLYARNGVLERLKQPPRRIHVMAPTPHVLCMPDEYKVPGNAVESYRRYYFGAKRSFATWRLPARTPAWWKLMEASYASVA